MSSLQKISDCLLAYPVSSLLEGLLPKVSYQFLNESSDIPDAETWSLTVTLLSTVFPPEADSLPQAKPLQSWSGRGQTPDQCIENVHLEVLQFLRVQISIHRNQQNLAQMAIDILTQPGPPPIEGTWGNQEEIQQTEVMADHQEGWSDPSVGTQDQVPQDPVPESSGQKQSVGGNHFYIPPMDEVSL